MLNIKKTRDLSTSTDRVYDIEFYFSHDDMYLTKGNHFIAINGSEPRVLIDGIHCWGNCHKQKFNVLWSVIKWLWKK